MTEFGKINTTTVLVTAKQTILQKILSGELKAGDRLPAERDLAVQMGISRSSIHQAIVDLDLKGFLKIVPRHGTVVCDYRNIQTPQSLVTVMSYGSDSLDFELFKDLMATRVLLETESAKLACDNIFDTTLAKMYDLIDEMEKQDNPSQSVYSFHYNLVKASGNSIYSMIYRGFEPILLTLINKHYSLRPHDKAEAIALSRKLLEAIEKKDKALAEDSVRKILAQGISSLEERYESVLSK